MGYWAAAAVVVLMGWSLFDAGARTRASAASVSHTLEVLTDIGDLGELLARTEAAQRGYLLSGQERFLTQRDELATQLMATFDRLRDRLGDNAPQQERLAQVRVGALERLALMRENADRRRQAGEREAALVVATGRGQDLMTRVTSGLDAVEAEERRMLELRRAEERDAERRAALTLAATVLLSLLVLVPAYLAYVWEARARRLAEERMYDLAHNLPGALYRLRTLPDGTRRFEFLSSGVEALRGVDHQVAMRDFAAMWETIVDEDRPAVAAAMAAAERDLKPVEYEFRVNMPDGGLRWLRASATLRREPDGCVLWNGYWSDVTPEKELQRELAQARDAADAASRAKSTFLATMSHEIRTPMNGVLGMLELLSLTRLDNEQRTTLGIIRESGRSLLRIIDDILDFSKIEAGKLAVRDEPASVRDVVDRVCNIYSGNASSRGLVLKRFVDGRISPVVIVDPLRLQQILNNFVSNSIKFTERGEVEVRADLVETDGQRDLVRFSVHDTGIGVTADQKARLFMPFAQAHAMTSQVYGGTGLGLSICRRLADMMGGTIEMDSAPGRGTTMTLTLPMRIADGRSLPREPAATRRVAPSASPRAAPSVERARADGRLVLLVDDHPINRMVLLKQINMLGYAAIAAQNGLEAVDEWSAGGIGLILTDCNMPEMNGYDLARHIRDTESRGGHARIPIIACTANALGGEAEKCFAAGMDDYVAKPIDLGTLAQKLDQWSPLPEERTACAAPGGADGERVLEPEVLAEITGGDVSIERDLLDRFRRYNAEDADKLLRAVELRDAYTSAQASHRIKGASRTIGALRLAAVSERIEQAARAQDWDGVITTLEPFQAEMAALEACIAASLAPGQQHAVGTPAARA